MSVSDYCQCARAITISNGGTTFCNITSNFGLCSISCSRRSADIIHHLVHGLRDNKLCGRRNAVWRTTNNLVIAKIVFIMQVLIFLAAFNLILMYLNRWEIMVCLVPFISKQLDYRWFVLSSMLYYRAISLAHRSVVQSKNVYVDFHQILSTQSC